MKRKKINIEEIEFIDSIYPRSESSIDVINSYKQAINPKTGKSKLPPIEVADIDGKLALIDGFHRLAAYRQLHLGKIEAEVISDLSWQEAKMRAIKANATHGKYYSNADRKKIALMLNEDGYNQAEIAELLSVTERTIRSYLKEERNKEQYEKRKQVEKLLDQGKTQTEIAEEVGISQPTVHRWTEAIQNGNPSNMNNGYVPDPLKVYDIWRFDIPSNKYGKDHNFGTLDPQVIEHLLYYFTSLGEKCVDPAAGQGLFLEVCERMDRKGLVYDIAPINHRVIKNDVTKGIPAEAHDADFILLDLPYYNNKVRNAYSSLQEFLDFVKAVIGTCIDALAENGKLAFVMQSGYPRFVPLIEECYKIISKRLNCIARISSPIPEHVSGNRFNVAQAKKEKRFLYCDRVIHVYQKA